MPKPPMSVDLTWSEGLAFRIAAPDGRTSIVDGDGRAGLSPVEFLAAATASCMAVDLIHILTKARQPVGSMRVGFTGQRAQTEPHRFTAVRLEFAIAGRVAQAQVDRAVRLSRDKYCSVWNSLREDITLEIVTRIGADTAR
jgi:putative redox protein